MTELRPTWIVWRGAGRPVPLDAERLPIRAHAPRRCSPCGDAAGVYRFDDLVSENFLHTTQRGALLPDGDALCAACAWCLRDLRLRCAPFVARESGVWFLRLRGELLRALLDPPEPPFVVALPLMGAQHGGEGSGWRAAWSTEPALPAGVDPLPRLQAKVCAPYAATALDRDRFALQVDGDRSVVVDRPLWAATVAAMGALVDACRSARCGYAETLGAAALLRLPAPARWHDPRALAALARAWPALTAPLRPHLKADWYRLVAGNGDPKSPALYDYGAALGAREEAPT